MSVREADRRAFTALEKCRDENKRLVARVDTLREDLRVAYSERNEADLFLTQMHKVVAILHNFVPPQRREESRRSLQASWAKFTETKAPAEPPQ